MLTSALLLVALGLPQTPQPAPPGLVLGRVVDAGTGRPVAGAIITVNGTAAIPTPPPGQPPLTQPARVMTNGSGQFVVRGLRKGSVHFTANKGGYVPATQGQRRPGGSAQPIEIDEGQRLTDVEIRMWRHAVLSGTVVDEAGEPVIGTRVQAYRREFVAGRRRYVPSAGGGTDDRGMYRLSLVPGDYVVAVPTVLAAAPADAIESLFTGASADPKRIELSREMGTIGASIAPAGSPSSMAIGTQLVSLGSGNLTPLPQSDGSLLIYPTLFYPAGSTPSQASPVTLRSGEERSGIDLQLRPARAVRVSGTVLGPDGPVANVAVHLAVAGDEVTSGLEAAGALTDSGGAFTFPALAPGQYTLRITRVPRPPINMDALNTMTVVQSGSVTIASSISPGGMAAPPPVATDPTLCVQMPLGVGEKDVAGLVVALRPGARITGRVELDGSSERPGPLVLQNMRIGVEPADGTAMPEMMGFGPGHPDENGNFTTLGIPPGRYVLRAGGLPGWTLRGAFYQGRDIMDVAFDLESADLSGVVITFTDRPSTVTGTVRSGQNADGDAVVFAFPVDSSAWANAGAVPRRSRSARAMKNGSYSLSLPPGEYYVIATKEDPIAEWQDPAFLRNLTRAAEQVRLGEGETKTQNLTVVPIR